MVPGSASGGEIWSATGIIDDKSIWNEDRTMGTSSMKQGPAGPSRRRFVLGMAASFGVGAASAGGGIRLWDRLTDPEAAAEALRRSVLPASYASSVWFGDSIRRLVAAGAVDPAKFQYVYMTRGGLPEWVDRLFSESSETPITFSPETAPYLLNLLWPLGIANKTAFNEQSPLNGPSLGSFASTAGWVLGAKANGAEYFNRVEAVPLNEAEEATVLEVARNAYRPCCDNSTFFQDCNHGSALLGLLELAASQGRNADELYNLAVTANSYWYPKHYLEMALYFEKIEDLSWRDVPAERILSRKFSSLSGWRSNVHAVLTEAKILPPPNRGQQGGCGV